MGRRARHGIRGLRDQHQHEPFSAWGDTASCALLTNGGFESGTAGWPLAAHRSSRATSPGRTARPGDSRSLRISQSLEVQLVCTTTAGGGDFQVDSVSADPCVRG